MEVKNICWAMYFAKTATALPYVTSLTEKCQTETALLYVMDTLNPEKPRENGGSP